MEPIQYIALAMGAAWASGVNLYATIAVLGLMGATGNATLPPELEVVQNPLVIGVAMIMYVVEFVADKVPGVDSAWDTVHTFIRIPAGAALAAGAVGDVSAGVELAAILAGGTMAATTHATKAGSRLMINTSPEPVSNWTASLAEDFAAIAAVWAAINYPWAMAAFLILFIVAMVFLLPRLFRAIKALFRRIGQLFSGKKPEPTPAAQTQPGPDAISLRPPE